MGNERSRRTKNTNKCALHRSHRNNHSHIDLPLIADCTVCTSIYRVRTFIPNDERFIIGGFAFCITISVFAVILLHQTHYMHTINFMRSPDVIYAGALGRSNDEHMRQHTCASKSQKFIHEIRKRV